MTAGGKRCKTSSRLLRKCWEQNIYLHDVALSHYNVLSIITLVAFLVGRFIEGP